MVPVYGHYIGTPAAKYGVRLIFRNMVDVMFNGITLYAGDPESTDF